MKKCILDMTPAEILGKLPKKVSKTGIGQTTKLVRHSNKRYVNRKVVVLKHHNDGSYNIKVVDTQVFLWVQRWQLGSLG